MREKGKDQDRRKRRFLIWGAVAAVGALITSAAFVDSEWVQISPEAGYSAGQFNLQLKPDGETTWTDNADSGHALKIQMTGAGDPMLPGDTLQGTYKLGEEHDAYHAALTLSADSTAPGAADQALLNALRFTVKINNVEIVKDAPYAGLTVPAGHLPKGAEHDVNVAVTLPASAKSNEALQGGKAQVFLGITGDATSTIPNP